MNLELVKIMNIDILYMQLTFSNVPTMLPYRIISVGFDFMR